MAEDKEKKESGETSGGKGKTAGEKLIAAACEAYGIAPKYVFASRIDEAAGEAIIVTRGGKKVRFKAGDKPAELPAIAVSGENPDWAKRKVIAGKGAKK